MLERRAPWLLAGWLMVAAGLVAAAGTYVFWLPCRGFMLADSVFGAPLPPGAEFPLECMRRMDAGFPFPTPAVGPAAVLGALASALLGIAWLSLVLRSGWPSGSRAVAGLPGLLALVMAVVSAGSALAPGSGLGDDVIRALWWLVELVGLIALGACAARSDATSSTTARLALAAVGCTGLGGWHAFVEYAVLVNLSEANWDSPPGTGYLAAAAILACATATLLFAPKRAHVSSGPAPVPARAV